MSYSNNPNLPKARAFALKLLILESSPLQVVASRCGVHRTTVWRWKRRWLELNATMQFTNDNRPNRQPGAQFRLLACRWRIPTRTSRPHTFPSTISKRIVELVLQLRQNLKRCAEVIWFHLINDHGVTVSLSSVRRILKRFQLVHGRKKRVRPSNPMRPLPTRPGELVQTDTIHYVNPFTKRRKYVYTVIDVYSRMAYAEVHDRIGPGIAAMVIAHASKTFGFGFAMVQADNGPEYSRYFEDTLARNSILTRHSRLHRPNDNSHIERFNRTVQEECLGRYLDFKLKNQRIQSKLNNYLAYYNTKRVHLSLQYRTPAQMLQRS